MLIAKVTFGIKDIVWLISYEWLITRSFPEQNSIVQLKHNAMNISVFQRKSIIDIVTVMLIILFFYTAITKLIDINEFRRQLSNQPLPVWSIGILLWLIPICEILVSLLLVAGPSRTAGLYGSALLMLIFTGYMGLVLLNVFERVPCRCGGVIGNMSFEVHFIFNAFFLMLSTSALKLHKKRDAV